MPRRTATTDASSARSARPGGHRRASASGGARGVPKVETHIPGFDLVAEGGLPRARSTLVAGTAGSGKTVFACHYLAAGVQRSEGAGVFVTFEDRPEDIRRNMLGFGWDIAQWESEGRWGFVDAAPEPTLTPVVGDFDLGGLLARVTHAVRKLKAKRVVLDSMSALFVRFSDHRLLRSELFRLIAGLKALGATVLFTAERMEDYGPVTVTGIEEFIADNVVILRNILSEERRRRTLEILKFRGTSHLRGETPFTIMEDGVVVIPLNAQRLTQESSTVRVTSGVRELDRMCGGGLFRDSVVLVSGATGTGKTLLTMQFLAGGVKHRERVLLFAFEESRDQLLRNAASWGMRFDTAERRGTLRVVNQYPHAMPMEDHLVRMTRLVDEFQPQRVAVDSLSALERVFSLRAFREFVISLTSLLKARRITTLFTSTTPQLLGGGSITEKHISTVTDSIMLLRYVELEGRMRRSINVLKMRGSAHDVDLREYTIDAQGMHVGEPFTGVTGILTGTPRYVRPPAGRGSR
ncbi:MAG: circadian clock protein KaiC [Gemmatimonadaceae bacterium]